jgi:hypothetical protein
MECVLLEIVGKVQGGNKTYQPPLQSEVFYNLHPTRL